jgi:hypothetical protein
VPSRQGLLVAGTAGEMLVECGQRDVGQQRRQDATLRGARRRVPQPGLLVEDPGFEERLDQRQDALVGDPLPYPVE